MNSWRKLTAAEEALVASCSENERVVLVNGELIKLPTSHVEAAGRAALEAAVQEALRTLGATADDIDDIITLPPAFGDVDLHVEVRLVDGRVALGLGRLNFSPPH